MTDTPRAAAPRHEETTDPQVRALQDAVDAISRRLDAFASREAALDDDASHRKDDDDDRHAFPTSHQDNRLPPPP